MDTPVGALAIAGNASSARHCVSGRAANVHDLGWVAAGTGYTITFESDITLATAIGRMDPEADDATTVIGDPGFNFNTSTAGTMALYVEGRGRAGCYRYKVEVDRPAQGVAEPVAPRRISARRLVRFTGPCWDGGGGIAVWTGIMSVAAGRAGQGTYVCQNGIRGGTWRAYNGR